MGDDDHVVVDGFAGVRRVEHGIGNSDLPRNNILLIALFGGAWLVVVAASAEIVFGSDCMIGVVGFVLCICGPGSNFSTHFVGVGVLFATNKCPKSFGAVPTSQSDLHAATNFE